MRYLLLSLLLLVCGCASVTQPASPPVLPAEDGELHIQPFGDMVEGPIQFWEMCMANADMPEEDQMPVCEQSCETTPEQEWCE